MDAGTLEIPLPLAATYMALKCYDKPSGWQQDGDFKAKEKHSIAIQPAVLHGGIHTAELTTINKCCLQTAMPVLF